jgi:hypothetical protein
LKSSLHINSTATVLQNDLSPYFAASQEGPGSKIIKLQLKGNHISGSSGAQSIYDLISGTLVVK